MSIDSLGMKNKVFSILDFFPNSTVDEHDSVASVLNASRSNLPAPARLHPFGAA
jgi:hypothetical protein